MQIYKITNIITNKSYIGFSKDASKRFKKHIRLADKGVNRYLYNSIRKYGKPSFSLEILEECAFGEHQEKEKYWIKFFNTMIPNGYNMTRGGEGGNTLLGWSAEEIDALYVRQANSRTGFKHGAEAKQLMSKAAILNNSTKTEEEKKNISNKISKALKIKYKSGELKSTIKPLFGKDNGNYVEINIREVLLKISQGKTLKEICEDLNLSSPTVGARLKTLTGKSFSDWRKYYGITGKFSNPKVGIK